VLDSLKSNNKVSIDSALTSKIRHVLDLFDRLHYVTQYNYTLLRDQLGHVSSCRSSYSYSCSSCTSSSSSSNSGSCCLNDFTTSLSTDALTTYAISSDI